jgi:hypothetical protein
MTETAHGFVGSLPLSHHLAIALFPPCHNWNLMGYKKIIPRLVT